MLKMIIKGLLVLYQFLVVFFSHGKHVQSGSSQTPGR